MERSRSGVRSRPPAGRRGDLRLCGQSADTAEDACPERAFWFGDLSAESEAADIPDGTIVSGKPLGYDQRNDDYADWDVPDYDAASIGSIVEGPLQKRTSSLGHTVFVVNGVVVEPASIQQSAKPRDDGPDA